MLIPETVRGLLEEASRFFSEVIAPLNVIGDRQGSKLQPDGTVRTPDGFKEAYSKYVEGGWGGAHVAEEWGGGGLPYRSASSSRRCSRAPTSRFLFVLC